MSPLGQLRSHGIDVARSFDGQFRIEKRPLREDVAYLSNDQTPNVKRVPVDDSNTFSGIACVAIA